MEKPDSMEKLCPIELLLQPSVLVNFWVGIQLALFYTTPQKNLHLHPLSTHTPNSSGAVVIFGSEAASLLLKEDTLLLDILGKLSMVLLIQQCINLEAIK